MKVGIDGSNLRMGGGRTHLIELLRAAPDEMRGIDRVIVWGARDLLDRIDPRPWLSLVHESHLEGSLLERVRWQIRRLPALAGQACDVVFAPGGTAVHTFHPRVVMSRNMLPFERAERRRYGVTARRLRLEVLYRVQRRSFEVADGVIFLTEYARRVVLGQLRKQPRLAEVIPHGVSPRFHLGARIHRHIAEYSVHEPFRLVYVSNVTPYKHQLVVADAVARLRGQYPIQLELVGPAEDERSERNVHGRLTELDPHGDFIFYRGGIPFESVHEAYQRADAFVFASSCENMPNILLEAMAASLPIACSNRGPMPEILRDGGVYFDPESAEDAARAIQVLLDDVQLRSRSAELASGLAAAFTWRRCAEATFKFLQRTTARDVAS